MKDLTITHLVEPWTSLGLALLGKSCASCMLRVHSNQKEEERHAHPTYLNQGTYAAHRLSYICFHIEYRIQCLCIVVAIDFGIYLATVLPSMGPGTQDSVSDTSRPASTLPLQNKLHALHIDQRACVSQCLSQPDSNLQVFQEILDYKDLQICCGQVSPKEKCSSIRTRHDI